MTSDHLGQMKKSELLTQLTHPVEVVQLLQLVFLTCLESEVREAHVDRAS